MQLSKFPLTAEESELLMLFEELGELVQVSRQMSRDLSGVSRSLKKLSEKYPVVEKRLGRWQMTPMGVELNNLNRSLIQAQDAILQRQTRLRIGTNREFAARVVAPKSEELAKLFGSTRLDFLSYENGTEEALKSGAVDVAFDCGRPTDPSIGYRQLVEEPISIFASKKFVKLHRTQMNAETWSELPHILCERLYPDKIMRSSITNWTIVSQVNDIASARELAKAHRGWALLPNYSVEREVASDELVKCSSEHFGGEKYGVWWLRERKFLQPEIERLSKWLKTVSLK